MFGSLYKLYSALFHLGRHCPPLVLALLVTNNGNYMRMFVCKLCPQPLKV